MQLSSKCAPMLVEYVPAWHRMQVKEPDAPVTTYSLRLVNNTSAALFDVRPLDNIQPGYEDKLPPCAVEYSPDPQSRQLAELGAPAASRIF